MPSRPTIAVFDIGNVLIRWDPLHLYEKLIADAAERTQFLDRHCSHPWNFLQDLGRPWAEAEAEAIALAPEKAELIRAYRARWQEMVPGAIEENVALLHDLKAAGVATYAITNFAEDTLAEAGERFSFLTGFIDRIVSATERLAKPDPAIFRCLLERHGLEASACAFIDDSAANIATARALGFHAVQYSPAIDARAAFRGLGFPV